jgi:hypothetical protein
MSRARHDDEINMEIGYYQAELLRDLPTQGVTRNRRQRCLLM